MKRTINEKGQSLVIIAIAFFGLVAIAALAIDGGVLYLNRRNAQTAADAAAMAGARELCVNNGSTSDIENVVNNYAITENGATAVDNIDIDFVNHSVTVITRIETSSFFAQLIGFENNTARAEASAGCFPPSTGEKVLPIAWTCRPPVGGSTGECEIHSIPWDVFNDLYTNVNPPTPWFNFGPGTNPNMLLTEGDGLNYSTYTDTVGGYLTYVLMDSDKFDPYTDCQELNSSGSIHCDFNDDGILDVEGGANRGWLYLGDHGGASALANIIRYGYPDPIEIPQWFPGTNGVAASVFDAVDDIKYQPVFVPVFNAICDETTDTDLPTDCPSEYEAGDLINGENPGQTYYRVPGFSAFVVTCVKKGGSGSCPGRRFAGIDGLPKSNSIKTVEGYFVSGFTGGDTIDPGGFDLGIYIVTLTK